MAVDRHTPTLSSNPSDIDGADYATAVDEEVHALWGYIGGILNGVAGTNTITATCATTITAYTDGLKCTLIPAANNTGNVTINIDGVGAVNLLDQNGNPLAANALQTGKRQGIEYDSDLSAFCLSGGTASANLTSAGVAFGNVQAQGVAGGATTSGSWQTYPLNTTLQNDLSGEGVSLASNQWTLQPGTYEITAFCILNNSSHGRLRLFNVTDSAVVSTVQGDDTMPGGAFNVGAPLRGRFTISAAKTFRIEYRVTSAQATSGLGLAANITGETEKYGVVLITRPAGGNLNFGTIAGHNLTISTADPSGGNDGDIWMKVAP